MRRLLASALFVFLLDRATKVLVVEWLDLAQIGRMDVAPPYLRLTMAWNRGINFGLGASDSDYMRWLLIVVAVVVSLAVFFWLRRAGGWLLPVCGGLVVGGAIGNAWDRIQYGAVADFLNMSCCGIHNPYAFNVADIAIFAGAFGLILFTGKGDGAANLR